MIYLPGNVPSLKNTKRVVKNRLIDSKRVREYRKYLEPFMKEKKGDFLYMIENLVPPYKVHFQFIRDSRRKFDYHNAIHILADLMAQHGWIEDDNADVFIPVFDKYKYSKGNGGVYIWVEDD